MPTSMPHARRKYLAIQEMDGELVVYDPVTSQANGLNRTAAVIWRLADGKTTVNNIVLSASRTLNAPIDSKLVWYTLEQLSTKNLMQTRWAPLPLATARHAVICCARTPSVRRSCLP